MGTASIPFLVHWWIPSAVSGITTFGLLNMRACAYMMGSTKDPIREFGAKVNVQKKGQIVRGMEHASNLTRCWEQLEPQLQFVTHLTVAKTFLFTVVLSLISKPD